MHWLVFQGPVYIIGRLRDIIVNTYGNTVQQLVGSVRYSPSMCS